MEQSRKYRKSIGLGLMAIGFLLLIIALLFGFSDVPVSKQVMTVERELPPPPPPPPPKSSVKTIPRYWDMAAWGDGQRFITAHEITVVPGEWFNTGIGMEANSHVIYNFINGTSGRIDLKINDKVHYSPSLMLSGDAYYEFDVLDKGKPDVRRVFIKPNTTPNLFIRSYENIVVLRLEQWFK
jgi:hypothetical protein